MNEALEIVRILLIVSFIYLCIAILILHLSIPRKYPKDPDLPPLKILSDLINRVKLDKALEYERTRIEKIARIEKFNTM